MRTRTCKEVLRGASGLATGAQTLAEFEGGWAGAGPGPGRPGPPPGHHGLVPGDPGAWDRPCGGRGGVVGVTSRCPAVPWLAAPITDPSPPSDSDPSPPSDSDLAERLEHALGGAAWRCREPVTVLGSDQENEIAQTLCLQWLPSDAPIFLLVNF